MNPSRRHWLQAAGVCGALATVGLLPACAKKTAAYDGQWVGANLKRGHLLREQRASKKSGALPPPTSSHRATVVIVGGGMAGLSCARALMHAGIDDVHVLELEDQPGGNSQGHVMDHMPCPLGAHYLPVPDERNPELLAWLAEIGLCRLEHGRWVFDERHLCHSPQERVFLPNGSGGGDWFEGLLPPAEGLPHAQRSALQAQVHLFSKLVNTQGPMAFTIPTARSVFSPELQQLDALTFDQWLDRQGLDAPALRWYLDYCCRDDYGASSRMVSAWAGLHYFASRHGFRAPGEEEAPESHAVLTWPEGNAWLSRRLAAPLETAPGHNGQRLHRARIVLEVDEQRHGVDLKVWNDAAQRMEHWSADHVVMATPLFIAQGLLRSPEPSRSEALLAASQDAPHAPWLVANVHLHTPLADRPGAPPSWDNVVYGSPSLGYVDAMHQSTRPHPGPTVLTSYWALGGASHVSLQSNRRALLEQPWSYWASQVVAEMSVPHPDLSGKVKRVDLMRYGHAMRVPLPGQRSSSALAALAAPSPGRVHFAHSDLSAYSILEEAFFHGERVGRQIASRVSGLRTGSV